MAGGRWGQWEGGAAHAAGDVAEGGAAREVEGAGELAEFLEGNEADVVEVVGVVVAGDEVLPEAEEVGEGGMAT